MTSPVVYWRRFNLQPTPDQITDPAFFLDSEVHVLW